MELLLNGALDSCKVNVGTSSALERKCLVLSPSNTLVSLSAIGAR
jgi:hypothetical protein